jgi:hypothetical protein
MLILLPSTIKFCEREVSLGVLYIFFKNIFIINLFICLFIYYLQKDERGKAGIFIK